MSVYDISKKVTFTFYNTNGTMLNYEQYKDPIKIFKAIECFISCKSKIVNIVADVDDKCIYFDITVKNNWDPVRFSEKRYSKKIESLDILYKINDNISLITLDTLKDIIVRIYSINNKDNVYIRSRFKLN